MQHKVPKIFKKSFFVHNRPFEEGCPFGEKKGWMCCGFAYPAVSFAPDEASLLRGFLMNC